MIGIVAESDLLVKEELTERHVPTPLQRRGRLCLAGTTAGEIMISPVVTIDSSQTLDQAARVLGHLVAVIVDLPSSALWAVPLTVRPSRGV